MSGGYRPGAFMLEINTIEDELVKVTGDTLHGWHVLLWNDDIHSMDYVVLALMKTIGLGVKSAVHIMLEAHTNGKAIAWSGAKETAEAYREGLEEYGLTATISS